MYEVNWCQIGKDPECEPFLFDNWKDARSFLDTELYWMSGDYPAGSIEQKEMANARTQVSAHLESSFASWIAGGFSFWIKDVAVFGRSGTEVPPSWFKPNNGDSR